MRESDASMGLSNKKKRDIIGILIEYKIQTEIISNIHDKYFIIGEEGAYNYEKNGRICKEYSRFS